MNKVRVRFAPSPTGPLHIGGLRTALYNYLFARKNDGTFILRIEDTDQNRFVDGALQYILDCLDWIGIKPDEGINEGGNYGPYRQSDRKDIYELHVRKLIESGHAYYAFDTTDELEQMRGRLKEANSDTQHYNFITRKEMKNSLTLSQDEVKQKLEAGDEFVVRLKVPENETIKFNDIIRGTVEFVSSNIDDKVLIKSGGMPTYHFANVVDDHLMEISHVIRGEEWLSSTPIHVLLYRYFEWESTMPKFAHLPLLLKPDGKGKLSKRDAEKGGFPIFPLTWKDANTGDESEGFKEKGFLQDALINFLAFLGWNPGTERELFTIQELCQEFTLERVHKSGSRFDYEKAKWFNQQYIKNKPLSELCENLKEILNKNEIQYTDEKVENAVKLMIDRITFPQDLYLEAPFLWNSPDHFDEKVIKKKWNDEAKKAVEALIESWVKIENFESESIRNNTEKTLASMQIQMGKIMPVLRVCITGVSGGPDLMSIINLLGKEEAINRLKNALKSIA